MTEQVVHLRLAEQKPDDSRKSMLESLDNDVMVVREFLKKAECGGFAILAYDKQIVNGKPELSSYVNYFTTEPADCFWLPDMAKTRLLQHLLRDDD